MSKSTELDRKAKLLLLSCMDFSNYDMETPKTVEGKIAVCRDIFEQEMGWRIEQVGRQAAVKDWLSGLATACAIPFYNHEIIELAKAWGSIPENATERQEDGILSNYWDLMSAKLCQLFDGYRVPREGGEND